MIEVTKGFNGSVRLRVKGLNIHLSNRQARILRNTLIRLALGGERGKKKINR